MAITREQILTEARSFLGTRFLHQGRTRDGVDCVGLLYAVASALGYDTVDLRAYSRTPQPAIMGDLLAKNADEIPLVDIRPGDILWMRLGGVKPRHTAFVESIGDTPSILHAATNGVRVQPFSDFPKQWFYKAFRMRGVID
jgi:cell wall-associated NlpC family hydrolase